MFCAVESSNRSGSSHCRSPCRRPAECSLTLSVEDSKVTRASCGLEPPAYPGNAVLRHNKVLQRGDVVTQTSEKPDGLSADATKLPSRQNLAVCRQRDSKDRVLLALGSKESAKPVMASSRAMRLRGCPPMLKKLPPTRILPSACTAIALTKLFAFGLKAVSSVPSGFSRAMRLRLWPPMLLKEPPTRILPSCCNAMGETIAFAFGLNESARPVVASSRAMKLRGCPPMLFAP